MHVPAGETSEGRARLYARNAARTHALDQLRIGAIQRIASALRLPAHRPRRRHLGRRGAATGRDPGAVRRILADDAPAGDGDLVRLAADLATLEDQVRATLAPATSQPEASHPDAGTTPQEGDHDRPDRNRPHDPAGTRRDARRTGARRFGRLAAATGAAARTDDELRAALNRVRTEVGKAVVGQDGAVTGLLIALLARGHVLLEGVPGVAKTLLVRTLSRALQPRHASACSSRPT